MTLIGHALTGLAVGAAVLPRGMSRWRMAIGLAVFALLADVPDFAVPGWGHYKYHVSHSIFVNGGLIAAGLLGLIVLRRWKGLGVSRLVIVGGAVAWLSHLLLDSMYNHGCGIPIYWPLSSSALVLPIPWLASLEYSPPPLNMHTFSVFAIELVTFAPLLGAVVLARRALKPNC